MKIYIDKGLREVSSKGREFKGDKCSPQFSPENCMGNWNGEKMERIVNFSTSPEYINSYVKTQFEQQLPDIQLEDIRESISPTPLNAPEGENKYLYRLFRNTEQIIQPKHKFVVISTHQYRLKDFFAFDKTKFDIGNKKKIGFKNCSCVELKFDNAGNAESCKVVWTPRDDGDPKYYYLSQNDGNFMSKLKQQIPSNGNLKGKTLLFIRHGQAHHNLDKVKNASHQAKLVNSPLTKRGIAQAHELHKGISRIYHNLHFFQNRDKILFMSSPLDRAIQTLLVACGPRDSVGTAKSIFASMRQIQDSEPGYLGKLGCYLRQTLRVNGTAKKRRVSRNIPGPGKPNIRTKKVRFKKGAIQNRLIQ